ncbi:MAG: hypothetical protein ACPGRW_06340 [Flavobacteriaceae bacterium]
MIIKHKKTLINIYDSIEMLPVKRFQKFNKLQLLSSDVGSDFTDYAQRIATIGQYVGKGLQDLALKELENLNMSLFNGFNEVSPHSLSFAILIKSIGNKEYLDYSEDGLQEVLKDLDKIGFDYENAINTMRNVKKN